MTEFDFHKLQTQSLKVTIKWSAFWVALSFCASVVIGVFKLGGIWNEQKTSIKETRIKTDINTIKIVEIQTKQESMQKQQDKNTYDIDHIKNRN